MRLDLADRLVKHGIVEAAAIEDPEGYDGGETLTQIHKAEYELIRDIEAEEVRKCATPQE
jgi:hypothetical protein